MANWAKPIPIDRNNVPLQEFPAPYISSVRVNTDNAVVSSAINLDSNTTVIEVGAFGGQGAVIRWVPTTENAPCPPKAPTSMTVVLESRFIAEDTTALSVLTLTDEIYGAGNSCKGTLFLSTGIGRA